MKWLLFLALIGGSWAASGQLRGGGVVATVMSNLGLERFLAGRGLALHRTSVGDRYVAEKMRETAINVGGEQSGHLILSDFATTGDGLVAAVQVLAVVVEQGRPASEVCRVFAPLPQLLRNVRFAGASPLRDARIQRAIRAAEGRLNGAGRLLIRQSGTEKMIRVMAEAEDEALVVLVVDELCATIAAQTRAGSGSGPGGGGGSCSLSLTHVVAKPSPGHAGKPIVVSFRVSAPAHATLLVSPVGGTAGTVVARNVPKGLNQLVWGGWLGKLPAVAGHYALTVVAKACGNTRTHVVTVTTT